MSRPPLDRALRRSASTRRPGPDSVPVAAGAALAAAAVNELRRRAA